MICRRALSVTPNINRSDTVLLSYLLSSRFKVLFFIAIVTVILEILGSKAAAKKNIVTPPVKGYLSCLIVLLILPTIIRQACYRQCV